NQTGADWERSFFQPKECGAVGKRNKSVVLPVTDRIWARHVGPIEEIGGLLQGQSPIVWPGQTKRCCCQCCCDDRPCVRQNFSQKSVISTATARVKWNYAGNIRKK